MYGKLRKMGPHLRKSWNLLVAISPGFTTPEICGLIVFYFAPILKWNFRGLRSLERWSRMEFCTTLGLFLRMLQFF